VPPVSPGLPMVFSSLHLPTVQQLLGQKDLSITMRYAHLSSDHTQAAAKRLEKVPAVFTTPIGGVLITGVRTYGMGVVRVSRAIRRTPASVLFRFGQTMQMV
jgi:hypothetical protein